MEDMGQDAVPADRRRVISAINSLLDRHGVPERKRLVTLVTALGLDYNQIRRRMRGETPWNVDEIVRLADYYRESGLQLLAAFLGSAGEPASLHFGSAVVPCCIWPGPALSGPNRTGPLVAVRKKDSDPWTVLPLAEAGDQNTREIRRLIFESGPPRSIAVVDDDSKLTDSIVEFLELKGLDARAYYTAKSFRSALDALRFDGFILDLVLELDEMNELLSVIRMRYPCAPIIILTGQVGSGTVSEDELAATVTAHRAQLYEKPTRVFTLFNALVLGFDGAILPPS